MLLAKGSTSPYPGSPFPPPPIAGSNSAKEKNKKKIPLPLLRMSCGSFFLVAGRVAGLPDQPRPAGGVACLVAGWVANLLHSQSVTSPV